MVSIRAGLTMRVPPGACSIARHSATADVYTVRWIEAGAECSGQLPCDVMHAYLLGCVVQYA